MFRPVSDLSASSQAAGDLFFRPFISPGSLFLAVVMLSIHHLLNLGLSKCPN